jgi:hypothetical protein
VKILVAVAALALVASGCAVPMGAPKASLPVLEELRAGGLPPMQVGRFAPDPMLNPDKDRSVSIRSWTVSSPVEGSFAHHLGATLTANLRAAGKLDPGGALVVEGLLTDSEVSSGLPDGHARLGARFKLVRDGKPLFERPLKVEATWPSTFIGAEAIPDASYHFNQLFDQLVLKLVSDPDFKAAAKTP